MKIGRESNLRAEWPESKYIRDLLKRSHVIFIDVVYLLYLVAQRWRVAMLLY